MIKVASVPDFLSLLCPVAHFIPSGCPLGALHLRLLSFPSCCLTFQIYPAPVLGMYFFMPSESPTCKGSVTFVEHSYRESS